MTATTQAVRERGIIFSGSMVKAILSGDKTQTRRAVKPPYEGSPLSPFERDGKWFVAGGLGSLQACPYGNSGDLLWVKESVYIDMIPFDMGPLPRVKPDGIDDSTYYRADGECCEQIPECSCAEVGKPKWRSARFMPKWAARVWLEVVAVRVERVNDISESDAMDEGVNAGCSHAEWLGNRSCQTTFRYGFMTVWDSINADRGYPWKSKPLVWAITFKRVESPPAFPPLRAGGAS